MLGLITATLAEADPVIHALKLKKIPAPFSYHKNEEHHLVVSGIGKCNAAAACGWLAQKASHTSSISTTSVAWLNFGIAGHPEAELGSSFFGHKITDNASGKVWYPHRINSDLPSTNLLTVDKPLDTYKPDQLHDMEASGFIEAGRKFSDAELVQTLKVVSDNSTHPLSEVNAKLAKTLIAENIESILHGIDTLKLLSKVVDSTDSAISVEIQKRWHFSVSQAIQLKRTLQRHRALLGELQDIPDPLQQAASSKEFLTLLQQTVDIAGSKI